MAGTVAGTAAGTTAGTAAGMMAGTITPVGGEMMAGTMMAGTMMVPPTGGDCDPVFLQCVEGCQDQMCVQNCFNVTDGQTQSLYNDFQGCLQDAGMSCPQGDTTCLLTTCETEYNACFGAIPMGMASCGDIFGCLQSCGPMDQACTEACVESGTLAAQLQFSDVNSCFFEAIDNGCAQDDPMCYNQACQTELAACQAGGGGSAPPPAPGSLSCGGTVLCLSSCEPNDNACLQGCSMGLAPDQEDELVALNMCAETNMCQDQACIEMTCSAEYTACFPEGTQSCGSVMMCIEACTTQSCLNECALEADMDAQTELNTLFMCLQENSCMAYNCPACSTEYSACTAP
jgi:hypothetical protein